MARCVGGSVGMQLELDPRGAVTQMSGYTVLQCRVVWVHDPASQYSSPLSDQTAGGGKPDMVILEEQLLIISFEASPISFTIVN